jgi:hypothetical protein
MFRTYVQKGIAAAGLALALAGGAAAEEPGDGSAAVEEIVGVLHRQGLIDDDERDRILLEHYSEQAKAHAAPSVASGLAEGLEWFGDLRLRHEGFYYDKDDDFADERQDDRTRFRYRARFGFKKQLNEWARVGIRLASGSCRDTGGDLQDCGDPRSTNRTMGDDEDFDPDEIFIDTAWASFELPDYQGIESNLQGGKISNPFLWKVGKDFVVFDNDITPEGAALVAKLGLGEDATLFGNAGAFLVDENSANKDPMLYALQAGLEGKIAGNVWGGLRTSAYMWRSLDAAFETRAGAVPFGGGGNLPNAFDEERATIADLSAYLRWTCSEDWPLLFYGTAVRNLTADGEGVTIGAATFDVDDEDEAYGIGIEVGDKKKWVMLGAGYFHVEANSVISQFTDSDLFDGFTNRKGWVFYGSRQLLKNTELNVTLFDGDSIENTGAFSAAATRSIRDADRKRLQTDIVFSF